METGDPKQVAVLGVLAVGAVGFLFTRVGGKAAPPAQATTGAARPAAAHTTVAFTLARDPFSHPRLAPKPVKADSPEPTPTLIAKQATALPSPLIGSLPVADLGPVSPILLKKASTLKPETPAPTTTIGLEAIAGASDTVAFLTVGGAESRPFRPSERIAGAIRLLRVEDGDVVLSGPKGKLTLGVGERKTL